MAKSGKKPQAIERAGRGSTTPSRSTPADAPSKPNSSHYGENSTQEVTDDDEGDDHEVTPRKPFRFFALPPELRLRIYGELLLLRNPVDLDPVNYRIVLPRIALFRVNRQMHDEAYRVFYGQTIRLFPTHGRFFHTKKPLLSRLPARYRSAMNAMELRLGPGWSAPPRCQNITPELGLTDCSNLRILKIFVECDPSEDFFAGFRGKNATEETYKDFCLDILAGIFEQVPSITTIEVDAFPAVKKDAPLVTALRRQVMQYNKILVWGPLRGWNNSNTDAGLAGLENLLADMTISDTLRHMNTVRELVCC